jgi:hypothetical protein
MNFAHPLALLLLLLLVPVAVLYWLRVRVPSRIVGTGLLWQKALAEEKGRRRWQRWRSKVSLAAQMIIVVLLTLAAAGPQIPASKRIFLIIDNSATMRATDVQPQPTRMDAAKEAARRQVDSLRSCDEMAVVTVSPQPSEVQPTTNNRTLLRAVIDSVQATSGPPVIQWAVKLAREIPMLDQDRLKPGLGAEVPPRIVLITDACSKEATKWEQEKGVEVLRVGTAAGNLGITCLAARRSKAEPTKCEVLVEVQNQGDQLASGTVSITVNDKSETSPSSAGRRAGGEGGLQSMPLNSFSIVKDGRWQHVFTLDLPKAARLTANIEPGDAYSFDDTAELDVPAAPAVHRVIFVGDERSCLKEILASNRRVELIQDDRQAKAIRVIDSKTPEKLPLGPVLAFSPGTCDLWQLGEAVGDPMVTRTDDNSPIVAGIRLFDAYVPEARQLQIAESVRTVARPILWAGTAPLGYAIDRPQGRVVVIAGNLATSNLGMQAAFPQLIAQSLDWLDGQPPWTNAVVGNRTRLFGGTDIRVPNHVGSDASALVFEKPWPSLWVVPAMLAAVLLIIEWCLYQRRWTS